MGEPIQSGTRERWRRREERKVPKKRMLTPEELLAGAQNPEGLTVLVDLAEQVLRTWQPAWSPFLSAPLREEALARLGSLSELTWISDGGYPGAERQRLLCHRRDDSPDPYTYEYEPY